MYNLDEFADGQLNELVNKAIKQVVDNINDRETALEKPRKVIITLNFEPDQFRDDAAVSIDVKTKLQSKIIEAAHTKIRVRKDKSVPEGQMNMDDFTSNVVQLGVRKND